MNEMIRDRRSIGWNKKHPRSWHSGGVSLSTWTSLHFYLLFCNSSMTADDSVTVSREKKMLRSGM